MPEPPPDVRELAERRAAARAARDFAAADGFRAGIEAAGWLVADTPGGFTLAPKPPYDVVPTVRDLPDRSGEPDMRRASLAVIVEGWPDDVRRSLAAAIGHTPDDVVVLALDLGNVDGAGDVVHELARDHPGRVEEFHVAGAAGYADARNALLRADTAAAHVWLDPSLEFTGDAVSPLLHALDGPDVVLAGGWGVAADPDWRGFHEAGPGEVEAVLGYLLAVRRSAALAAGGLPAKARFYRNADIEFSYVMRDAGGRAVATPPLPVVQHRHRGYYDTEQVFRDRESKRNYERFLARFRGRDDLRIAPHSPVSDNPTP